VKLSVAASSRVSRPGPGTGGIARDERNSGDIMSTQPQGPFLPAAAAGAVAGRLEDEDTTTTRSTDDGVPVGDADAEADAVRSGARPDDDDTLTDPGSAALPDAAADTRGTDDGVPVGAADADADRRRSTSDDA
jgi:hypothetical protein